MTLNLNDHLLQTPNGLLATLLGDLVGEIVLGLVGQLLGAALLRWGHRRIIASLGNGGRGSARLVLGSS